MSEQYSEDSKHIEKLYEFDEHLSESTDKSKVRFFPPPPGFAINRLLSDLAAHRFLESSLV